MGFEVAVLSKFFASAGAVVVAFWASAEARANDTMAVMGAGDLTFSKTDELEMASEDLYLSPREVRISYVFHNLTDHDVRGRVTFPLPEIPVAEMSETPHAFHASRLNGDIVNFHIEVGGHSIDPTSDVHAYVKAPDGSRKDVTELLRKYHLPLVDPESGHCGLDAGAIKELVAAGALMDDEVHHPTWSVTATYYWDQVFPAGESTSIIEGYSPVLGATVLQPKYDSSKLLAEWCPDHAFDLATKKLPTSRDGTLPIYWLEYVLRTGANRAGPITNLRIEIDKAGADLISFCPIPGLRLERSGQSFIATAMRFTPTNDLKVLFVYRTCERTPCQAWDNSNTPR